VLPVATGFWSIFALLSANEPHSSNPNAVSWIRKNIIAAVAGALADAYNADHPPPSTHIDNALRDALVRLDDDVRTGQPWARNAGRASALLAFFDSKSRVLRVVNTGPGRAFLGRRVSGADYECMELVGPGKPRYLELESAQTRRVDVEEFANEDVIPSRGPLDVSSVETRSVEVRDGDFLVLGSESVWAGLEGLEAVQAVSAWIREQDVPAPEGKHRTLDPALGFEFPWKDEEDDFGLDWVGGMIPAMMRNFEDMFSRSRGNPAGCLLRRIERRAESGRAPGQDGRVAELPVRCTSSPG
jgi:serine/threonine protein phosphatase PrpC